MNHVGQPLSRLLIDEYFYPLYHLASDLDMPVCIHAGSGSFDIERIWASPEATFARAKFPGISAFHQLLYTGMPDKFPKLRIGFVELSSQWLPYALHDLERRVKRRGRVWKDAPLRDNRIWVACQTNDDHETVMRYVGDDNLMLGTDYGHSDTSTEVYALQEFRKHAPLSADRSQDPRRQPCKAVRRLAQSPAACSRVHGRILRRRVD